MGESLEPGPVVTIAIPIYNGERHLQDAISSVLAQEFSDLELLLIDDGSTDSSLDIARDIRDRRVRILENATNRGIPWTQNRALLEAQGHYFGILDQDDIALPQRLARQVAFLDRHPDIAAVGASYRTIGKTKSARGQVKTPPNTPEEIKASLLFYSAMHQPVVTGRTQILRTYGYREELPIGSDYDLWSRLARDHALANLPDVLALYRQGGSQTSKTKASVLARNTMSVQAESLQRIGLSFSEEDLLRHFMLPRKRRFGIASNPDAEYLDWLDDWIVRLRAAAIGSGEYQPASLDWILRLLWRRVLKRSFLRGHLRPALKHRLAGFPSVN